MNPHVFRTMKITKRLAISSILVVGIFISLGHLGPLWAFTSSCRILDVLSLSDGTKLIIVSRSNRSFVEPYTVSLYRIWADGTGAKYFLGNEDSYWWRASLKVIPQSRKVEVRALGQVAARKSHYGPYSPDRSDLQEVVEKLQRFSQ